MVIFGRYIINSQSPLGLGELDGLLVHPDKTIYLLGLNVMC